MAFQSELVKKYGENQILDDPKTVKSEWNSWYKNHTEMVKGEFKPKASLYGNNVFKNLNSAQKKFYESYMVC